MKKIGIILAVVVLGSCGFSSYNLEPSFLRYPFEKILDYELDTAGSGNKVLFVPESTLEEGILIYDYYDDDEGSDFNYIDTYNLSFWDGTDQYDLTPSLGTMFPFVFPLTDENVFVQVLQEDTFGYELSVFQVYPTAFEQTEIDFRVLDLATDFPGLGTSGFDYPCFGGGRLYFVVPTETAIIELSYQVSSTAVSDPQRTWTADITMADLYDQFFLDIADADTFWQAPSVELEGYRHYPDLNSGTTVLAASMNLEFQSDSDIRFLITYDGTLYSGLQISADVYNIEFLSGGYVLTEERDEDNDLETVTLYDCTGTAPVEVDSLTFSTNELSLAGEGVYNDEAVILWTPEFDYDTSISKVALYALPVSYLLGDAE